MFLSSTFNKEKLRRRKLSLLILALVVSLSSLLLSACGDTATSSAPPPTVATTAAALPTFTPSQVSNDTVAPTAALATSTSGNFASASSSSAASVLNDSQTSCGKIPYYVSPKLNANGLPASPIYAAVGASDTVGTGSTDPQNDSWDAQLAKMLPQNYQFLRLGIGGITLNQANQCMLPKVLVAHPTIVTDWNVVNDIVLGRTVSQYQSDLEYFLQEVTKQTDAKILIGNVPNLNDLPFVVRIAGKKYNLDDLAKQWNDAIAQEVAKYPGRVYLVNLQRDLSSLQQHPEWVSGDGLHPTAAGYTQIAQAFEAVIKQNSLVK